MLKKIRIVLLTVLCCLLAGCGTHPPEDSAQQGVDLPSTPEEMLHDNNISPDAFNGILSTNGYTVNVLKSDGSLWSIFLYPQNAASYKIIPLGREDGNLDVFGKVMDHVKFTYASSGDGQARDFCFAITEDDTLWGWGNLYMNADDEMSDERMPKKILESVVQVCQVGREYYALQKNGDLWVWGRFRAQYEYCAYRPVLAASGVTKLLSNEEASNGSVWYIKGDGNAYQLVPQLEPQSPHQQYARCVLKEELVIKNAVSHWGKTVLDKNGTVWDTTGDQPVLITEDAIQISGKYLTEYVAVTRDGNLFAWDHEYPTEVIPPEYGPSKRNLTPLLIVSNCRYFVYGYSGYSYIDFDGRLCEISKEGKITVIDENVCYADGTLYVKSDGTLWVCIRDEHGEFETKKLFDDVMRP